jgi:hypothetical protein
MASLINSTVIGQSSDISQSFDAGASNFLIAGVMTRKDLGRSVDSVKFNGVDFTQNFADFYGIGEGGESANMYWYTLKGQSGSATFEVNTTGSASDILCVLYAISGGVSVAGTGSGFIQSNTSSPGPFETDISITQTGQGDSFAAIFGTVRIGASSVNYHTQGTGYTEVLDSQGLFGDNNAGKYSAYRFYTDGAGEKIVDDGGNNLALPGPGAPRTYAHIGILIDCTSRTSDFFNFFPI